MSVCACMRERVYVCAPVCVCVHVCECICTTHIHTHVCVCVRERLYIVIHYNISVYFKQLNLQQNLTYKRLQDDHAGRNRR